MLALQQILRIAYSAGKHYMSQWVKTADFCSNTDSEVTFPDTYPIVSHPMDIIPVMLHTTESKV